jgi:predicted dithiol-disulfide oxidoreductase (DUF899 family)
VFVEEKSTVKTKHTNEIGLPKIVEQAEWRKALVTVLDKEKAATHARDSLADERRRVPMVRIEKDYVFVGPAGKVSLINLFGRRKQLILYHFMFVPGLTAGQWPAAVDAQCSSTRSAT